MSHLLDLPSTVPAHFDLAGMDTNLPALLDVVADLVVLAKARCQVRVARGEHDAPLCGGLECDLSNLKNLSLVCFCAAGIFRWGLRSNSKSMVRFYMCHEAEAVHTAEQATEGRGGGCRCAGIRADLYADEAAL